MNSIKKYGLLVLCLSVTILQGETNQFVKEKRTKKVSTARLKEDIGELLGQSLLHSTEMVEKIGKLQRELMQMTAHLIEQPKESKLTQADRLALDKTIDKLSAIECDLKAGVKQLSEHIEVVKNQY